MIDQSLYNEAQKSDVKYCKKHMITLESLERESDMNRGRGIKSPLMKMAAIRTVEFAASRPNYRNPSELPKHSLLI